MRTFGRALIQFIKGTDTLLLFLCLAASAFGVVLVHSATLNTISEDGLFSRETITMLAAIALGLTLCMIISVVDYEITLKLWPIIAGVCLLLMLSLFVFGVAPDARSDARNWLPIGGIYFQPSELLKIAFIITFTVHIDWVKASIHELKTVVLLALHGAFPIGLVIITGDLGSALVFAAIFIGMMFVAGVRIRYFIAGFAVCFAAAPLLWIRFFSEFQKQRFWAVYHPQGMSSTAYKTVIYQQQQSINAIGSGQLTGKGLFKGTFIQNGLVPVDESDMIFAVVGEELGLLGALGVLILLALIILKIVSVGKKSKDRVGSLLCYGTAIMIGAQAIINIGMCLKLLPCIGITLPFFSAGGSSNLCVYIGIGFILSVYRANRDIKPVDFRLSSIRTPFSEI